MNLSKPYEPIKALSKPYEPMRLEYVWVEPLSEPTGAKESSTQSRGDLPYSLLQLLESVDKEQKGVRLIRVLGV